MHSERTWHKGPPPHVGWWNASVCQDITAWRWWDGACWSAVVRPFMSAHEVLRRARIKTSTSALMAWSDYWPENARVPRIDPRKEPSNAQ